MNERILMSRVHLGGNERKYIDKAFEDDWVLPLGPNVDEFEHRLEKYLGADAVVALSAGTAAIHLGLVMLGVGPGDEVICQSFTFAASANPIIYQGAKPVFVDSEAGSWNIDPEQLERAIVERHRITGRYPKAIIPVDLYGMPARLDEILDIAGRYGIPVLEDAAEALGSVYKGRKCSTWGNYGALSFNGNKIITTSGGGALVCPDKESAGRVKFYATQARENRPYYYHETIGYNYRLSNISAGIGCGQMEVLEPHIESRRRNHAIYMSELADIAAISVHDNPSADFNSNFWLTTILIDPASGHTPDDLRLAFADAGIESRLLWRPMHMQPVFAEAPYYGSDVCEKLFDTGLCLPSGSSLTDSDLDEVISIIRRTIA
ncbi:MAG: DegT/DnrJ/EryC1/StrS family aminotransferase [Muribaculaceae bacterium]